MDPCQEQCHELEQRSLLAVALAAKPCPYRPVCTHNRLTLYRPHHDRPTVPEGFDVNHPSLAHAWLPKLRSTRTGTAWVAGTAIPAGVTWMAFMYSVSRSSEVLQARTIPAVIDLVPPV